IRLNDVGDFDGLRTVLNLLSTGAVVTPLHRDCVGVRPDTQRRGRFERYREGYGAVGNGRLDRGNAGIRVRATDVVGRGDGGVGYDRCVIETRRRGLRYGCSRS